MIEKLFFGPVDIKEEDYVLDLFDETADKINELVDAVNKILAVQEQYATIYNEDIMPMLTPENSQSAKIAQGFKNLQDPYAEQRKWIGKLCEFWDNDDTQQLSYGVLTKIDTESGFGVQYCCNDEYDYDDCQPVKPTDSIIYKGGNNE